MSKRFRPVVFLMLAIMLLACALPTVSIEYQPSSSDQVATAVAMTLQALTPVVSVPMPSLSPLPQTLYYLGTDGAGISQVFRVKRDGKTITQLTFETINVTDYDVSLTDSGIAYVAGNLLVLANVDGSNRRILIDGGSSADLRGFYNPVFSPDGSTLAYAQGGLNLYNLSTGISELVIQDHPLGGPLPLEIYSPEKYSPDGTKLLVKIGHPPDSPWTGAIYSPSTRVLMQFAGEAESITCCTHYGGAEWLADSSGFYAVAKVPDSSSPGGQLWKVDAVAGAVTTLMSGGSGDGAARMLDFPYKPYLAPDGQLYFFYLAFPESSRYFMRAPLQIVRSAPDGLTNRTVLRPETFELMNEALWSPDASFVIVVFAPAEDVLQGGRAEIVYLDGRPNVVLTTFAQQMKWGP